MQFILEATVNPVADAQLHEHFVISRTLRNWGIRRCGNEGGSHARHRQREQKDTQSNMPRVKRILNIWAWTVPGVRGGKASAKPAPPPPPPPAAASSSSSSSRFSSSPGARILLAERKLHHFTVTSQGSRKISCDSLKLWQWEGRISVAAPISLVCNL